jgi:2-methylcitrate dehydratase PrpD
LPPAGGVLAMSDHAADAPTVAERLGEFVATELAEEIEPLRLDVARRVLDTIGVSLAAAASEPAGIVSDTVVHWGDGGQATAVGRGTRHPVPSAAMINGTLAHALDFDDTHMPSVLHPSACVVPAALAVAEGLGLACSDLVPAIAIGNEITVRLGMAGYDVAKRDSVFFERGLHATSICGAVGAAAAAAVLLGLDAGRAQHALATAAGLGAGLLEANRMGGSIKRIHCGWAAHVGITAAQLAAAGLTGPPTVFEGRMGFFRAFCDGRADLARVTSDLGATWEMVATGVKPYPTNIFTQPIIDAARVLRDRGLSGEQLAEVELGVPGNVLRTIAEPLEQKRRPPNGYTARFSGPFAFAVALAGGSGLGVYLDDFTDDAVRDDGLLATAAKVVCRADETCDAIFPDDLAAIARVRTVDGQRIEVPVLAGRGGPARPLSDDELGVKFRLNAGRVLTRDRVEQLLRAITELDDVPTRELLALTVPENVDKYVDP